MPTLPLGPNTDRQRAEALSPLMELFRGMSERYQDVVNPERYPGGINPDAWAAAQADLDARVASSNLDNAPEDILSLSNPATAIVPTALNMGRFMSDAALGRSMLTNPKVPGSIKDAAAYMFARYPRILNRLSGGIEVARGLPTGVLARTGISESGEPVSVMLNAASGDRPIEDLVNSLSHELRHVVDLKAKNFSTKLPYYYPKLSASQDSILDELKYWLYANQPVEARARQTGEKGAKSYQEFERLRDLFKQGLQSKAASAAK
jgi:hypothetical protein